jgi:hypothetical protein
LWTVPETWGGAQAWKWIFTNVVGDEARADSWEDDWGKRSWETERRSWELELGSSAPAAGVDASRGRDPSWGLGAGQQNTGRERSREGDGGVEQEADAWRCPERAWPRWAAPGLVRTRWGCWRFTWETSSDAIMYKIRTRLARFQRVRGPPKPRLEHALEEDKNVHVRSIL